MKIKRLTIKNFRSFKDAQSFEINSSYTTFTGVNNCGKSNVLRALDLFFNGKVDGRDYNAALDMHQYVLDNNLKEKTSISLNVELQLPSDKQLISGLKTLQQNSVIQYFDQGDLTISLNFGKSNSSQVQFTDPVTGQRKQPPEVQSFFDQEFRRSVSFIYVPAIKDLNSFINRDVTIELLKRMFNTWGRARNPQAKEFKDRFDNIKKSINDIISTTNDNITSILKEQTSDIKNFFFNLPFRDVNEFLSHLPISLDDNVVTDISRKGSGIHALTLFSLLRYLDKYKPTNKYSNAQYIWAIEEPETFLHPTAQRRLKDTLFAYSSETAIFITTHSFHFLNSQTNVSNFLLDRVINSDKSYPHTVIVPTIKNQWRPFIDVLGDYKPDFIPPAGYEKVYLFLEGKLDIRYFRKALSYHPHLLLFFNRHIELVDGEGDNIKRKAVESKDIYKLDTIVLVDGDDKGVNYFNYLKSKGFVPDKTLFKIEKPAAVKPTVESIVSVRLQSDFLKTLPPEANAYWSTSKILSFFDNQPSHPPDGWDSNGFKNKLCSFVEKNGLANDFRDLEAYLRKVQKAAEELVEKRKMLVT